MTLHPPKIFDETPVYDISSAITHWAELHPPLCAAESSPGNFAKAARIVWELQIENLICNRSSKVISGQRRAAALAGIKTPGLCASDQLKTFVSCRLCRVQISTTSE